MLVPVDRLPSPPRKPRRGGPVLSCSALSVSGRPLQEIVRIHSTAQMKYPASRKLPLIETIHGVPVADPYRWLEDPDSPETRAWIDAQNTLTRSALDGPARETLVRRLTDLYDFPQTLSLQRRGGRYFFTHNPGLLNQPILYVL